MQKCSVVNGAVKCSQLQTGLPWDEHKKELDSLIEQYREQLKKLKVALCLALLRLVYLLIHPSFNFSCSQRI